MTTVLVASQNPVKISAVKTAFEKMFPAQTLDVVGMASKSGVPDQPVGYAQTLEGAKNRVSFLVASVGSKADYFVGIEGGIEDSGLGTEAFAWACVRNRAGQEGLGRTGSFYLPAAITQLLKNGIELGDATDKIFNEKNSKQNSGAVGLLTCNLINRTSFYTDAVIFALIPFKNQVLYF